MKKLLIIPVLLIQSVSAEEINQVGITYYDDYYTMSVSGEINVPMQIFLDIDNDTETGYSNGNIEGADRLIEIYDLDDKSNNVYTYEGISGSNEWNWDRSYKIANYSIWTDENTLHVDLDRYYLGMEGDPENDQFNYRIQIWDNNWDNLIASYPEGNGMRSYSQGDCGEENSDYVPPYNAEKFQNILENSYLQFRDSHTVVAKEAEFDGFSSKNFRLSDEMYMTFEMLGNQGERNELRNLNEFNFFSDHSIGAVVNINAIDDTVKEITWMQLHHKIGQHRPFVRLAWIRKNRKDSISGEWHAKSLWAIVSNSDEKGSGSQYIYLSEGYESFFYSEISMSSGRLTVSLDDREIDVFSYLDRQDIADNWNGIEDFYYKAGLYFNKGDGYAKIQFDTLEAY